MAGTCHRENCTADARWLPVLLLYAPRWKYPNAEPARGCCALPVCDEHRELLTVDHLVTDDGWDFIIRGFQAAGKILPDRKLTRIEFIRLDSREAREFREQMKPKES